MLTNGDKLVVKKNLPDFFSTSNLFNEGDIVKVTGVDDNGLISFSFGANFEHTGIMDSATFEKHFEKMPNETENPMTTWDYVKAIIENSKITVQTVFDKCTVVSCKLPNGFVIVESYVFANHETYDEETGISICIDKIEDKVWELENYKIQDRLYEESESTECPYGCNDCCDCPCDEHDECHAEDDV